MTGHSLFWLLYGVTLDQVKSARDAYIEHREHQPDRGNPDWQKWAIEEAGLHLHFRNCVDELRIFHEVIREKAANHYCGVGFTTKHHITE